MSLASVVASAAPARPSPARIPAGGSSLSTARVNAVVRGLLARSRTETRQRWLSAVARLVADLRPDLRGQLIDHLGAEPSDIGSPLEGLSIGEIGVVYEALTALTDHHSRRDQGQYFTPDDVAAFMAAQSAAFPEGRWLDPCCGVGNLSWHLANAMPDPAAFVADRLTLIDLDPVALRTAQALLIASFAAPDDASALPQLVQRSRRRNFLTATALPPHDFVIVNPPYAGTARIARFRTADARELYAYFLERIATGSRGFIAITPASHLGGTKYAPLRRVLEERSGGDVYVFDNVPDTCFRGYKFGSTNSSRTNFVRAAITVSAPAHDRWRVTPILRWAARSRARMWRGADAFLVDLRHGPHGEWAKVMPGTESVWDALAFSERRLRDILSPVPTEHALQVASTPRYYISASKRHLDRGSKHTLFFSSAADMDRAYVLLNSSLPYWWWRCLDGGITLPTRNLMSLPVPEHLDAPDDVVRRLEMSESSDVVTKLNAGRQNENVRRPRSIVDAIDAALLPGVTYDFAAVYAPDMFEASSLDAS